MKNIKTILFAAGLLLCFEQGLLALTAPTPFHAYQVAGPAKIISALEELRQLYNVSTELYVENLKKSGYNRQTAAGIMKALDVLKLFDITGNLGLAHIVSHINALILQDFPELADKNILESASQGHTVAPPFLELYNRLNRPIGAIFLDK